MRCPACALGSIRPLAVAGRVFAELPVPAELEIPTCDHCGEEWIDLRTAEALDRARLEHTTRKQGDALYDQSGAGVDEAWLIPE